jgi:hypothetical protein
VPYSYTGPGRVATIMLISPIRRGRQAERMRNFVAQGANSREPVVRPLAVTPEAI